MGSEPAILVLDGIASVRKQHLKKQHRWFEHVVSRLKKPYLHDRGSRYAPLAGLATLGQSSNGLRNVLRTLELK